MQHGSGNTCFACVEDVALRGNPHPARKTRERVLNVKPEQSILNNQFTMLDCEMIGSLFVIELFALIAGFAGLVDTELFEDAFIDL